MTEILLDYASGLFAVEDQQQLIFSPSNWADRTVTCHFSLRLSLNHGWDQLGCVVKVLAFIVNASVKKLT